MFLARAVIGLGLGWWVVASAAFPEFSGLDLTTGKATTARVESDRKALALVFLSAECPCSRGHEPVLAQLASEYPQIAFIGIHSNTNENLELARRHFQQAGLPFRVIQDTSNRWADRYGALKTPHLFLINGGGEILYRGGVDDSRHVEKASHHFLADALAAVQAGRRPEVAETRTLGCVIPR